MDTEKIVLSGSPIEIAEFEDHKMATFLISVLDEYDLNGRMIPKESGELYHSSIVGFPILAKMVCDENGQPTDFAGHEMYIKTDKDGNSQVRFDTHPIGSVVESWIEERPVAGYTGNKSCIMIKAKLWSTRYPEYFAVLDKLWAANNVKSSWELTVQEVVQTTKGRILKAFSFIGNTLLGSKVVGAVPGAGVYEYAQADPELELAAALSKDVCIEAQRKEDEPLDENMMMENQPAESASVDPVIEETVTDPATEAASATENTPDNATIEMTENVTIGNGVESAALTVNDLRRRIADAYINKVNKWAWMAFWFPENHEAWLEAEGRESELDFVKIAYEVNDDAVTITGEEFVKLTVSVAEINNVLEARDNVIEKANAKINELSTKIAELQPYKDAADQAERERMEAEIAEKREKFREKMVSSKLFSEDELETSEVLKSMIERMDEVSLKNEIAERFMAKLDAAPAVETAQAAEKQAKDEHRTQVDANDNDSKAFMRIFLGKD